MQQNQYILKKPKYYPSEPSWAKKVYMPVSMNNRLLRDYNSTREILEWIFERTDQCDAIVGDYLHRHNVMLGGTREDDAIMICSNIGKEFIDLLNNVMLQFPAKKLNIQFSKGFCFRDDFSRKLNYFNDLYKNNFPFSNEIDFLVHQFLERQGHIDGNIFQLNHCKSYLLEELVIFEMLAEEEYLVNIYPGKQLRIFKNIVTGRIQNISKQLEHVSLVELKFKPLSVAGLIKNIISEPKKNE